MSDSTELRHLKVTFYCVSAVAAIGVAALTYFFPAVAIPLAIIFTSEMAGKRVLARAQARERKQLDGKKS